MNVRSIFDDHCAKQLEILDDLPFLDRLRRLTRLAAQEPQLPSGFDAQDAGPSLPYLTAGLRIRYQEAWLNLAVSTVQTQPAAIADHFVMVWPTPEALLELLPPGTYGTVSASKIVDVVVCIVPFLDEERADCYLGALAGWLEELSGHEAPIGQESLFALLALLLSRGVTPATWVEGLCEGAGLRLGWERFRHHHRALVAEPEAPAVDQDAGVPEFLSAAEVAELAGVNSKTVSNWRRTILPKDCIAQRGYHRRRVIEWLIATGRMKRRRSPRP